MGIYLQALQEGCYVYKKRNCFKSLSRYFFYVIFLNGKDKIQGDVFSK